jgi:DNA-directed RNA polymerase specialized sigma24 family protein
MPIPAKAFEDEISLLPKTAAGSVDTFLRLVHTYDRAVLSLALRATGSADLARRIYLDVFLTLRREAGSAMSRNVRARIYRLTAQVCLEHLRQRVSGNGADSVDPLNRALHALTPHERMVLELRIYERLDFEEVAEALDATAAAAASMFARAMGRLRTTLGSAPDGLQCTRF